jgi:hypothetical protein
MITRFHDSFSRGATSVYAWAFMPNLHLLLRTGREPLSRVMRRILTGYAVSFNRRHKRTGHLFQNRFKSILVEEKPYLLQLVRYIHLNPLRGSVVKTIEDLDSYPWSGWRTKNFSSTWVKSHPRTRPLMREPNSLSIMDIIAVNSTTIEAYFATIFQAGCIGRSYRTGCLTGEA